MKKLIYLFVGFLAALSIAATTTDSDITGVSSSGTSSFDPSPAGTDWIVGLQEHTANEVIGSSAAIYLGPYTITNSASGTGVNSYHQNSTTDDTAFGVRVNILPSSTSGFQTFGTDLESIVSGDGTYRVGTRVMFEDLPVSGADDYFWYIGFNSHANILNTSNYAMLGISLADNATNFVVQTHGGSAETVTDTGVAFAADTWYNLEIELSPTAVSAWIDGVLVLDASTSNVPVSAVSLGIQTQCSQRVGVSNTAVRNIYKDWDYIAFKPGTARGTLGSGGPF